MVPDVTKQYQFRDVWLVVNFGYKSLYFVILVQFIFYIIVLKHLLTNTFTLSKDSDISLRDNRVWKRTRGFIFREFRQRDDAHTRQTLVWLVMYVNVFY